MDVFNLRETQLVFLSQGYRSTGEWKYANRKETLVTVGFERPDPIQQVFNANDLLDDLTEQFIKGKMTRNEASQALEAIMEKGGVVC